MGTKSALFLIQTPLHVINALEAIAYFDIGRSTFFIVTSANNEKWRLMIEQVLPDKSNTIYCLRDDFALDRCTEQTAIQAQYLKAQFFDLVFFCDARLYIFVDIVNSLNHPDTYLMDDGTGTLLAVDSLIKTGIYYDRAASSSTKRQQTIDAVKQKYGLSNLPQTPYNLFTVFDIESCDYFSVVSNPLNQLRRFHSNTDPNTVLILGQPFIRVNHLTIEDYLRCLSQLCSRFASKTIHYLPHPREDIEELRQIAKHCDLTVLSTTVTAEQFLLDLKTPPATVTGFYSTSLWNIAKFQPGVEVVAFRIPETFYNTSLRTSYTRSSRLSDLAFIDLVYDYFAKRLEVCDL